MKKIIVALIIAALAFVFCSCDPGIADPASSAEHSTVTGHDTLPDIDPETQTPDTEQKEITTEAETEPPVTEIGEYTVINTALAASKDSSGTLYIYSDGTYKASLIMVSSELGVASRFEITESGTFRSSDEVNLICTASRISVKVYFDNDTDRSEALETLKYLQEIDAVSEGYVSSYEKACGQDGLSATAAEAASDEFLSTFTEDKDTEVFLDKEKSIAYDVTVKYDLPDGVYRIEEEGCVLTLDPNGNAGECSLDFSLYGDDGDGLGRYTESTILKGTYVRDGDTVTCTIKGELTVLRYDSPESQQAYLDALEEAYANGEIIDDVYNYNKSTASEEGRYLDYGSDTDEYKVFVMDLTHSAVFTSTPSQEFEQ